MTLVKNDPRTVTNMNIQRLRAWMIAAARIVHPSELCLVEEKDETIRSLTRAVPTQERHPGSKVAAVRSCQPGTRTAICLDRCTLADQYPNYTPTDLTKKQIQDPR